MKSRRGISAPGLPGPGVGRSILKRHPLFGRYLVPVLVLVHTQWFTLVHVQRTIRLFREDGQSYCGGLDCFAGCCFCCNCCCCCACLCSNCCVCCWCFCSSCCFLASSAFCCASRWWSCSCFCWSFWCSCSCFAFSFSCCCWYFWSSFGFPVFGGAGRACGGRSLAWTGGAEQERYSPDAEPVHSWWLAAARLAGG